MANHPGILMKPFPALALVTAITAAGCTTVEVNNVDTGKHELASVCIERNDKVIVKDFLSVIENGFQRHGIQTSVHEKPAPASCRHVLTYTAERGWDVTPYLDFAELRLSDRGTTIGSASYRHSGGFALNKWASTASKMDPVIDELLTGKKAD